jgi:hypothetical protein
MTGTGAKVVGSLLSFNTKKDTVPKTQLFIIQVDVPKGGKVDDVIVFKAVGVLAETQTGQVRAKVEVLGYFDPNGVFVDVQPKAKGDKKMGQVPALPGHVTPLALKCGAGDSSAIVTWRRLRVAEDRLLSNS